MVNVPVMTQPQITPMEPESIMASPHIGVKPESTEQHENAIAKFENAEMERFKSYKKVSKEYVGQCEKDSAQIKETYLLVT